MKLNLPIILSSAAVTISVVTYLNTENRYTDESYSSYLLYQLRWFLGLANSEDKQRIFPNSSKNVSIPKFDFPREVRNNTTTIKTLLISTPGYSLTVNLEGTSAFVRCSDLQMKLGKPWLPNLKPIDIWEQGYNPTHEEESDDKIQPGEAIRIIDPRDDPENLKSQIRSHRNDGKIRWLAFRAEFGIDVELDNAIIEFCSNHRVEVLDLLASRGVSDGLLKRLITIDSLRAIDAMNLEYVHGEFTPNFQDVELCEKVVHYEIDENIKDGNEEFYRKQLNVRRVLEDLTAKAYATIASSEIPILAKGDITKVEVLLCNNGLLGTLHELLIAIQEKQMTHLKLVDLSDNEIKTNFTLLGSMGKSGSSNVLPLKDLLLEISRNSGFLVMIGNPVINNSVVLQEIARHFPKEFLHLIWISCDDLMQNDRHSLWNLLSRENSMMERLMNIFPVFKIEYLRMILVAHHAFYDWAYSLDPLQREELSHLLR